MKKLTISFAPETSDVTGIAIYTALNNLSKLYGGGTFIKGFGSWIVDGKSTSDTNMTAMITTDKYKEEETKKALEPLKAIGCKWIHVDIQDVEVKHFQLEYNAETEPINI